MGKNEPNIHGVRMDSRSGNLCSDDISLPAVHTLCNIRRFIYCHGSRTHTGSTTTLTNQSTTHSSSSLGSSDHTDLDGFFWLVQTLIGIGTNREKV